MSDLKIEAPIKVEIKVIAVKPDGTGAGEVTFELPPMRFPTKQAITDAINEVSTSEVLSANGLRIANQKETFDYIMRENSGTDVQFAMPRNVGEWFE